jgi:ferredoxin
MSVRVQVDQSLCQGHGRCLEAASGVFAFDETEGRAWLVSEEWDEVDARRIELAARNCPERAITVSSGPEERDPWT